MKSDVVQKVIIENELQNHLEDGWKVVGVLSNEKLIVERNGLATMGFIDIVRRIIPYSEVEDRLKEGWDIATMKIAVVLPSGRYIVERPKS